jgi:hypothetical protein
MKKRGSMTRSEARDSMRGKRSRMLLRESSGPQMEMTGPVQQRRAVDRAIRDYGLQPVDHVYTLAYTGTDILSTQIVPQILADARAGKIDILLIAYASRFARDLLDAMTFLEGLIDLGVSVYFCKEDVLCGRDKSWLAKIGPALLEAHNFSDGLSDQREETIQLNWEEFHTPSGRPAWGYRFDNGRPARIVKNDAIVNGRPLWEARAWCFEEYTKDKTTLTDLARKLNAEGYRTPGGRLFAKTTLLEVLRNPIARGVLTHHRGRPDEDTYYREDLRIVSDELFNDVQRILARRKRTHLSPHRVTVDHVLRDLAVCGDCGGRYWSHGAASRSRVSSYSLMIGHPASNKDLTRCRYWGRYVSETTIVQQLERWLSQLRLPPRAAELVERFQKERPGVREFETMRKRLKDRDAKALEAYLENHITKETWLEQKAALAAQIASLPPTPGPVDTQTLEVIENLGALWRAAGPGDRCLLAQKLFERIVIDAGEWGPVGRNKRRRRPQTRILDILVRPAYRALINAARAYWAYVQVEPSNSTYPNECDEVAEIRSWLAAIGQPSASARPSETPEDGRPIESSGDQDASGPSRPRRRREQQDPGTRAA